MRTLRADGLKSLVTLIFERMGASREDAGRVATALVKANL